MRDTILWRLRAQECAWIDCDTKHEWISDMKITKSQLKQIIKEELGALLQETMDFDSMDDRELEAQAHQDGIEDFLIYDYEGDIVNREEIIQALKDIVD